VATEAKAAPATNGKRDDDDEPLLDLPLVVKRPTVKIGGELYELAKHADFGIIEQHQLKSDGDAYDKLWEKESLNSTERKQLKAILDRMFDRVFLGPAKVKEQIDDALRAEIVRAFTYAPLLRAARERDRQEQAKQEETEETADLSISES